MDNPYASESDVSHLTAQVMVRVGLGLGLGLGLVFACVTSQPHNNAGSQEISSIVIAYHILSTSIV